LRPSRTSAVVAALVAATAAVFSAVAPTRTAIADVTLGGPLTVRGFRFRGISPREGPSDDPIGGDYILTGSAAVGFPLYDETLRGVVFTDFGSVDADASLTTIRVAAGFGFRLALAPLGNVPLAFDFAWPINKRIEDEEQVFSFSLGILQ